MDDISEEWIRSKGKIRWIKITGTIPALMQHYDRATIQEVPIPPQTVIIHQRPRPAPVIDAEQVQRGEINGYGYPHRFSLRDLK